VDLTTDFAPAVDRSVPAEPFHRLHAAIERDPRHHLRVGEMAARPAHFPDPFIRLLPRVLEVAQQPPL
jgi:hypothetical protein